MALAPAAPALATAAVTSSAGRADSVEQLVLDGSAIIETGPSNDVASKDRNLTLVARSIQSCPPGRLAARLGATLRQLRRLLVLVAEQAPNYLKEALCEEVADMLGLYALKGPGGGLSKDQDACLRAFSKELHIFNGDFVREKPYGRVVVALANLVSNMPSCDVVCKYKEVIEGIMGLIRSGNEEWAEGFFELSRGRFTWTSFWQVPPWFAPTLSSRPIWDPDTDLTADTAVFQLVSVLRAHWRELLREFLALLEVRPSAAMPAYQALNSYSGTWTKVMLYDGEMSMWEHHRKGFTFDGEPYPPRVLHPRICERLPVTCGLIGPLVPGIADPRLPYAQADQEQVNFFSLAPGSHIAWHSAAQNGRLTVHTCLAGCGGESFIQIGPHKTRWKQGEPIVFDDSYMHRVETDAALTENRIVFHVMVMHPEIDTSEKYRQHDPAFNFAM